jgi:hypothetical protein
MANIYRNKKIVIIFYLGRFELEILSCSAIDDAEWVVVGKTRFGLCESSCRLNVLDSRRLIEPFFTVLISAIF